MEREYLKKKFSLNGLWGAKQEIKWKEHLKYTTIKFKNIDEN
jgi:hypothetical protein